MLGDSITSKPGQSSLPLQIFVYFDWHYTIFFFLINICLFTYKSIQYYYPSSFLGWDLVTICLYFFVNCVRLLLVTKGNKTAQTVPLGASIVLALPIIALHAYYFELQTYVLRIDMVLNSIAFVFFGVEILATVYMIITLNIAAKLF